MAKHSVPDGPELNIVWIHPVDLPSMGKTLGFADYGWALCCD